MQVDEPGPILHPVIVDGGDPNPQPRQAPHEVGDFAFQQRHLSQTEGAALAVRRCDLQVDARYFAGLDWFSLNGRLHSPAVDVDGASLLLASGLSVECPAHFSARVAKGQTDPPVPSYAGASRLSYVDSVRNLAIGSTDVLLDFDQKWNKMESCEPATRGRGVLVQPSETLQQLYEARRLAEAWQEYQRLLGAGTADAEVHLLGALTARFLPTPDYREARRALERAEAEGPSGITLGKVRLSMGNLLREIGDTSVAIERFESFISGIEDYPELRSVCFGVAYHNLGSTYRCCRRYDEALSAYAIACREFRANDFPDYLRQCLQNQAWLQCLTGDAQGAEAALVEAEDLCKTDVARWHQRIGWAFLEAISGDSASALRRCESIIQAENTAPAGVVSHAFWVAGQVALTLGQLEQAGMMADQAVSWSLRVKDDIRPMQDANSLRREIYQTKVHKDQSGA